MGEGFPPEKFFSFGNIVLLFGRSVCLQRSEQEAPQAPAAYAKTKPPDLLR